MTPFDLNDPLWTEVRLTLAARPNNWTEVSFQAWLNLPETRDRLLERYGVDWSPQQAFEMCLGVVPKSKASRRKSRVREPQKGEDIPELASLMPTPDKLAERVEGRLDEYRTRFEDITPADQAALRDLAAAEIASEEANRRLQVEFAQPEPRDGRIKILGELIRNFSGQTRALQNMLRIDRSTREQNAQKHSDVDEVLEVIREAGRWVLENAVPLTHTDCPKKPKRILVGFLVLDFREFPASVTVRCPACDQDFTVQHIPNETDLLAVEPPWVATEEDEFRETVKMLPARDSTRRTEGIESDDGNEPDEEL